MQGREQVQRHRDGRDGHVRQLGPGRFVVGADGGVVLGQGEAVAAVAVQVRVGEVVDDLPATPAAGAVGQLQTLTAGLLSGGQHLRGQIGQLLHVAGALGWAERRGRQLVVPNGIAQVLVAVSGQHGQRGGGRINHSDKGKAKTPPRSRSGVFAIVSSQPLRP